MKKLTILSAMAIMTFLGCENQSVKTTVTTREVECADGDMCGKLEVPEKKCFRTLPHMNDVQEKYTEMVEVEKECQVIQNIPKVTKIPVKTYRTIEEWVETPVRVPYYEEVKVRAEREVPVEEEYLAYVEVEREQVGLAPCTETTVTEKCVCKPYTAKDKIEKCDDCGNMTGIDIDVEGQKKVIETTTRTETALCPVKKMVKVKVPVMKKRIVKRDGFYTKIKKVKKYRTVPGKKLVQRRVCETIMVDKKEYEKKITQVKRKMMVPVEKTRTVKQCDMEKTEVDCVSGYELMKESAENGDALADEIVGSVVEADGSEG